MVGHLLTDARDSRLTRAIQTIRTAGIDLNINLLGEAILGNQEANNRLAATRALIERDDVDYVSIKVSATVAPHNPWAHGEAVDEFVVQLRPLFRAAMYAETGMVKHI